MNQNITALITGATSGFGKAIAIKLASDFHWDLVITGRRRERLDGLASFLEESTGVKVYPLCFDVRDKAAVKSAISGLTDLRYPIEVLVNNAGLASGLGSIDEGDTDDWDLMVDTNVKGLLYVTREVVPLLKKRARGHIINIGSTAAKTVYKNGNVYCATKAAVDSLSQAMRIDLLPYGIKVTAIHPGAAETEFSVVRFHGDEERARKVYEGFKPLAAEDVANVVGYALSLPPHVCINDLTMTTLTQANGVYNIKEEERIKVVTD
jgi:NADP-dependent 3-hydroxy acid dehydrogenase YdfG